MSNRRILCLWFPRLGAERVLRLNHGALSGPLAIVTDQNNSQILNSLSAEAEAEGLRPGQPLRDAMSMCPTLITQPRNVLAEAAFLSSLRRWASKYSPWVSEEPPTSLAIDLSGCAHLFGGEESLLAEVEADCTAFGLTVHAGIADTVGAAWALARYAGQPIQMARTGDAVDQEAHATRARATKRRNWEKGGPAPRLTSPGSRAARIAPPGHTHSVLSPLPIGALRLQNDEIVNLSRIGLRKIGDIIGTPRAALGRRYGKGILRRLDQALGIEAEPVSPARPTMYFAVRLTLPEPIGLADDILAAIDRLLPSLSDHLLRKQRGVRRLKMEIFRSDQTRQRIEIGLARPSANPDRIRPLLAMKVKEIDPGYGIDVVRLEAHITEPLKAYQHKGHFDAATNAVGQLEACIEIDDLIGKVGARIGLEYVIRLHPTDSHVPEKTSKHLAAAWCEPANYWSKPTLPRPMVMWRPESVSNDEEPVLPVMFRWRGRHMTMTQAIGPERIAPEWWLDDPDWRSGVRDYWQVTTTSGERLWMYYAHGGTISPGWFCQGNFP